jgi:hypothetical protein
MINQRPELEVRRQMLTQMRDNFRAQGFEAETNVDALAVQLTDGPEAKTQWEKMISDYRSKAENCYRSAEALTGQLAKLPKPKKGKGD